MARSVDGGSSFAAQQSVAVLNRDNLDTLGLRAPQFVSGDVDVEGTTYLAWAGCSVAIVSCENSEIFLARSRDGVVWDAPAAVPSIAVRLGIQSFLPGLAVEPGTAAGSARLAIVYYTMDCGVESCPISARLITSVDGGRTWTSPQRLSSESMPLGWLARTRLGQMLGDYTSVSYSGGRPVPVFALSAAPTRSRFNEAIFATRLTP